MTDSKSNRSYGPLSPIHIQILRNLLDEVKSNYEVYADEDLVSKAQVREKNSIEASPHLHNTSPVNLKEYLYIKIPLKDILTVRHLLVKLGFEQTLDSETEITLQTEEFVCPKCNYLQNQAGYCPKHHLLLIPYFDIRLKQFKFRNFMIQFSLGIIFSSIILMIIYFTLKQN